MKAISFILLIIVIVVLAMTNPVTDDFKEYIEDRIESQNNSGSGIEGVLRDIFAGPLSDLVAQNTTRENYFIFSVYNIPINEKDNSFLGIAGHFFPLDETWKEALPKATE